MAPLALAALPGHAMLPQRLSPRFLIQGQRVVLLPQEAGPIAARWLRLPVASLRAESRQIVDALDAVISGP